MYTSSLAGSILDARLRYCFDFRVLTGWRAIPQIRRSGKELEESGGLAPDPYIHII
jgi:hypothetical protein